MPSRSRWARAERFVVICTGLLVADFVIGLVSYGHCTDAGETCSITNEWVDSVTFSIAALLILLIAVGVVVAGARRHRYGRRS